jgi:hypothetical protein
MSSESTAIDVRQIPALLRGEPELIASWVRDWKRNRMLVYLAVIWVGAGFYGAAIGSWRDPLQACYTAIKFPLVVLLTTLGNALLNGMLAPLLGLNIGFRQSMLVIFMSFTIAAAILGAFSPLVLFMVWNTPSISSTSGTVSTAYSFMQLATVAGIAFAGVMANVRLLPLLRELSGNAAVAYKVLFAWLAGNLLLGSQVCWLLRPFIGDPHYPVEFYTRHPFEGNFFESVFHAARHVFFH